jgi:hypothetical protein
MPFEVFNKLKTEEEVIQFFRETYPDATLLIGE